jgi:transposase
MAVVGVDTGKSSYEMYDGNQVFPVERSKKPVRKFLKSLEPGSVLCMEATGKYHLMIAEMAYEMGFSVYVVNPADFRCYRDSVCYRAKTDPIDARILARYAEREHDRLRPWVPPQRVPARARELLQVRDTLVGSRVALQQSLGEVPLAGSPALKGVEDILEQMRAQADSLESEIEQLLKDDATFKRLHSMRGFGVLTAAMLTWIFAHGTFASSDKLVAFVGLDVRVRESGKWNGQRKLTKRGDALARKLLYNAANTLRSSNDWKQLFLDIQARGWSKTAATIVVARKLLRIAFALVKHNRQYFQVVRHAS